MHTQPCSRRCPFARRLASCGQNRIDATIVLDLLQFVAMLTNIWNEGVHGPMAWLGHLVERYFSFTSAVAKQQPLAPVIKFHKQGAFGEQDKANQKRLPPLLLVALLRQTRPHRYTLPQSV